MIRCEKTHTSKGGLGYAAEIVSKVSAQSAGANLGRRRTFAVCGEEGCRGRDALGPAGETPALHKTRVWRAMSAHYALVGISSSGGGEVWGSMAERDIYS